MLILTCCDESNRHRNMRSIEIETRSWKIATSHIVYGDQICFDCFIHKKFCSADFDFYWIIISIFVHVNLSRMKSCFRSRNSSPRRRLYYLIHVSLNLILCPMKKTTLRSDLCTRMKDVAAMAYVVKVHTAIFDVTSSLLSFAMP